MTHHHVISVDVAPVNAIVPVIKLNANHVPQPFDRQRFPRRVELVRNVVLGVVHDHLGYQVNVEPGDVVAAGNEDELLLVLDGAGDALGLVQVTHAALADVPGYLPVAAGAVVEGARGARRRDGVDVDAVGLVDGVLEARGGPERVLDAVGSGNEQSKAKSEVK